MNSQRFASVAAVESWLAAHTDYEKMARFAYHERAFNLDRTRVLLRAVGDPQRSLRIVHVAGTKGKGSVSHMISSILSASGKRPGLFTSPHLVSILERVRVDGAPASPEGFCRDMESVAAGCESIGPRLEEQPTFFERMLAFSALHHAREGVTRAVYEVGLGGRLDATNVLEPDVCVITRLGLDHTHVLGDTLALIAAEKAGIIKPSVPVVAAASDKEGLAVVEETARRIGAPLFVEGRDFSWNARRRGDGGFGIVVDVDAGSLSIRDAVVPLAGLHQGGNAAAAVVAASLFSKATGDGFGETDAINGLGAVRIPGRLDLVRTDPPIVIDVAHNEVSMAAGVKAMAEFWPGKRVIALAGLSADKDARAILKHLCAACHRITFTTAGTTRAADPAGLEAVARELGFESAESDSDFDAALGRFVSGIGPGEIGLITGSFFIAGRAMRKLGLRAD